MFEQGNGGSCNPILVFLAAAYENRQAVGGMIGQYFLCLLPPPKLKENPGDRTRSKKEEDDDNKEEEDCSATTAAAAGAAAATAAATTGLHTRSAATASDQAVAAVAAAGRSGLRWGAVAAAADSRMPMPTIGTCFFVFLTKCSLHVAQNTMFHGSFPPDSGFRRIPEQNNLALEAESEVIRRNLRILKNEAWPEPE